LVPDKRVKDEPTEREKGKKIGEMEKKQKKKITIKRGR
jgi:hypothetical protein